ncbi:hypothetical protein [Flavobacterium soli]|uniref:hypothetical protein n=1 Tax=Flavobacterium soli TaxID=344881 RepID=UPI000421B363|nr:hypothetical protein [Flavobacterium soli]
MNAKNEWFKLNKGSRNFLYTYLTILLLFSLISSGVLIFLKAEIIEILKIEKLSILGCIVFPLLGSSIFYIRKLYKASINLDIVEPSNNEDQIRQIGIIFYFVLRPIFSIGLGLLLFLSFKIGVSAMVKSPELNDGFVYSCMFFSFFIGYSSGDVIDKLEKVGKNIVRKSFDSTIDN